MLEVTTLIKRIRYRLHDVDEVAYTDEEILDTINMAVRFIRRCIADIRPSLLATRHEGELESGVSSFDLPIRPTKIIHLTAGDQIIKTEVIYNSKKIYYNFEKIWQNHSPLYTREVINYYREKGLRQTELAQAVYRENDETGTPREFYLIGEKTIILLPIPKAKTKYTVITIDDIEELKLEDRSPLNTEYDDFIVEYASIRLSVGNEYTMMDEQTLMSNIYMQIQRVIMPPPSGVIVRGYW